MCAWSNHDLGSENAATRCFSDTNSTCVWDSSLSQELLWPWRFCVSRLRQHKLVSAHVAPKSRGRIATHSAVHTHGADHVSESVSRGQLFQTNLHPAPNTHTHTSRPTHAHPLAGPAAPRIIGGAVQPDLTSVPFLVSVQRAVYSTHVHLCTGTALSATTILTSASCMIGAKLPTLSILAGVADLSAAGGTRVG